MLLLGRVAVFLLFFSRIRNRIRLAKDGVGMGVRMAKEARGSRPRTGCRFQLLLGRRPRGAHGWHLEKGALDLLSCIDTDMLSVAIG
jgi:hypothetical protein